MAMDFKNLQFLSCGLCRHTVLLFSAKFRWNQKISWWVMAKKAWIFKNFNFWSCDYSICYSVPNFIKIGWLLTEIWRFNDFQNGGRPPSRILKICSFCHVALVYIPFCFLIQNFAEIGQSIGRWVMAKKSIFKMASAAILNFKNFNFWSRDCNRVQYLM